jgi:hypothetical protein
LLTTIQEDDKRLLRRALKLLVVIHINGDIKIKQTRDSRATINHFFGHLNPPEESVTPCFIRGQLGPVFEELALSLMKDVLKQLEYHCLSRICSHFPLVISTFAVVFMAVESGQYHAAKDPFHSSYDGPHFAARKVNTTNEGNQAPFEENASIEALLNFYKVCFSGCHSDNLLSVPSSLPKESPDAAYNPSSASTKFVNGLKFAVEHVRAYLIERKAVTISANGAVDVTDFFDRLLARLFLLEP